MKNAKQRYRLTSEAAQDLLSIARYTVENWGIEQSRQYASELESKFALLASKQLPAKPFGDNLPDIIVWHSKYHSVYYTDETNSECIVIIAVLHQKMNSRQTVENRLP